MHDAVSKAAFETPSGTGGRLEASNRLAGASLEIALQTTSEVV